MRNNFGTECQQGKATVNELLENGQLGYMLHVISPINNDQNRTKTCRILKETNAEVKARLPGPAYYVALSEVDGEFLRTQPAEGTTPCSDMSVHGTFLAEGDAIAKAREVADGIKRSLWNARLNEMGGMGQPGVTKQIAVFKHPAEQHGMSVVQVRYDRGR
jgi:hypothetical protein